jgi:hypothetical protein
VSFSVNATVHSMAATSAKGENSGCSVLYCLIEMVPPDRRSISLIALKIADSSEAA